MPRPATITAQWLKENFIDKGRPVDDMGRFLGEPGMSFDGPALLMMMSAVDLNTSGRAWDVAYRATHPVEPRDQYEQVPFSERPGANSDITPEEYAWAEREAEDLLGPQMGKFAGGLLNSRAPLPEPVFKNAVQRAKIAKSTTSTEGIARRIYKGEITGEQRRHAAKEIGWAQLLGQRGAWPEYSARAHAGQESPANVLSESEIRDAWQDLTDAAYREVAAPNSDRLIYEEPVNGIQKLLSTEPGRLPEEAYEELLRGTHPAFKLKDGQWLRGRAITQTPYPEHHKLILDQLRTRKEEYGDPQTFDHRDLDQFLSKNHHYKPEFLNEVFNAGFPEMIASRASGLVGQVPGLADDLHDHAIKSKDSVMAYDLIRNGISSPEQMAEHIRAFPRLKKQLQEDGHAWTNPDLFADDKVAVAFGTNKLRQARDFILSKGKTELPPKQMPAGDWSAGRAKNGNISAAGLQQAIDNSQRIPYNVTHDKWEGAQRHSDDDSKVFQLNTTLDQVEKMKKAGVYDKFQKMYEASQQSSHPVGPAGIGWVRYTGGKGQGIFIDEVQSDLGQSFVRQAAQQAAHAGEDPEEAAQRAAEEYGDEDVHKTISNILFGGKHPSEVLQEAFHEWLRTPQEKKYCKLCGARARLVSSRGALQCNNNNPARDSDCPSYEAGLLGDLSPDQVETKRESLIGEPIHIWQPESKAVISLGSPEGKLPGHFYVGYRDVPSKKLGMKPGEYGELKTQKNVHYVGRASIAQHYFKSCPSCNTEVDVTVAPYSPKGGGYRECPHCNNTFETFGSVKRQLEKKVPAAPTWKDEVRKNEDQREQRPQHTFQEHALPGSLDAEGYKLNISHMPGTAIATVHCHGKVLGHVELVDWEPHEEWHDGGPHRAGLREATLRILEGHARGKQEDDGWHNVLPGERLLSKAEPGDLHPETPPGFHTKPQGSHVTAPHQNYSQAAQAKPRGAQALGGANIHVRQHHEPSNAGRTLMVQFSTHLLQGDRKPDQSDAYYDSLYQKREGYHRGEDFWEVPQWQAHIANSMPNVDHYTVRDPKEAIEFLKHAGYKNAAFSSLDVTAPFIRQLAEAVPSQNIAVGGYTDMSMYKGLPNVQVHPSVQSFVESEGHEYKPGYDYRHFQGMKVIPRLTLSDGCRHQCTFCCVPKQVVEKPMDEVLQQADAFGKHLDSDLIYLNDKTFGQAPNHVQLPMLYQRIRAQNPNFKGFVIQTTAAQMKRMTPEFLRDAGIRHVELGIESVNDPILKAHKKPANEALINEATQKIRQAGSSLIPNIMVGLPGEDRNTYGRTMDWLKKNRDIISHVNAYNLALYEDSELGKKLQAVNAADRDENQQIKSWMVDPQVHKDFSDELFRFANEQLDQPIGHVTDQVLTQPMAKAEDSNPPLAASVLVYNENAQILIGKRQKDGKYCLPGGHLEPGEDPATGAVRELYEEAGIVPEAMHAFGAANAPGGIPVYMFQTTVSDQTPHSDFDPDHEFSELVWVDAMMGLPPEVRSNLAHGDNDVVFRHMGWL
jgi:8-oxo-dGTP pyrophosphatase MutT (NUDIX family)